MARQQISEITIESIYRVRRPYWSDMAGINKLAIAYPEKYSMPNSPITNGDLHSRSGYFVNQLVRVRSLFRSIYR